MDKGNVDKYRRSMSGLRVTNAETWGRNTAAERYGAPQSPDMKPKDASAPQKLGDATNLRAPDYDPNHPQDWVRGFGKGEIESAEGKPNFDHSWSKRR